AAPQMTMIDRRFELNWLNKIAGNQVQTKLGPASIPPSSYTLWHEIYNPEELSLFTKWFDEAEQAVSTDAESLVRVQFMRKQLLDVLKTTRAAYIVKLKKITALRSEVGFVRAAQKIIVNGVLNDKAWLASKRLTFVPYFSG